MKKYLPPRETVFLWQLRIFLASILLIGFLLYFGPTMRLFRYGVTVLGIISAVIIFVYVPLFLKSCEIKLVGDSVVVERGVLIRNIHILPFSRLIYTQTFTTPLAKSLQISAFSLKAARSRIFVPELNNSDAAEIITALTRGQER